MSRELACQQHIYKDCYEHGDVPLVAAKHPAQLLFLHSSSLLWFNTPFEILISKLAFLTYSLPTSREWVCMNILGRGFGCWLEQHTSVHIFTTAGPVLRNGKAVLPALGQSAPGVLEIPPLQVNFGLQYCCQSDEVNCFGSTRCSIHSATFDSIHA